MKEFNLTEYLKNPSQKVVTRDGREVRIICTNMKNEDDYKIVALVEQKKYGGEEILCYRKSGRDNYCPDFDLLFDTIKKEGWVNIYKDKNEDITYLSGIIHDSEKEAKEAIKGDPEFIATIKIEWEE